MTISIDATVGGASANAFVTEVEQIAYMAARLNASAWTTVSGSTCTEDEKKAMIEATRDLSDCTWKGYRVDTTQALSWPRECVENPDAPFTGNYYASTIIPQRVKNAAMELAFQYLKAGTTDVAALDALDGVTENTIDVITKRYDVGRKKTGLARYPRVLGPLQPLLSGAPNSVRLTR